MVYQFLFIEPSLLCFLGCSEDVEGQANRKVSLQRYREKRKDRCFLNTHACSTSLNAHILFFMCRRFSKAKKARGIASSSLELFLNLHPRMSTADSQNLRGTGESHVVCESAENQTRSPNLSIDLNSEGMKNHTTILQKSIC